MLQRIPQFAQFCVVGTIGFLIDSALTLTLAVNGIASPLFARAVAFLVAASATWLLNRNITFRSPQAGGAKWILYILLTGVGGLVNVGVYTAWINGFGHTPTNLLLGVCFGSAVALGINFAFSKYIVFPSARKKKED